MNTNSSDRRKADVSFQTIVGYLMNQHIHSTKQECEDAVFQNSYLLGNKYKAYAQEVPNVSIGYFMRSSVDWLKDAFDTQFFTSPSVQDTRLMARDECLQDLEKMRQCELQRRRATKRRRPRRKPSRVPNEPLNNSSSDDIATTREFQRFFQMVARHRANLRSSSESPDRNERRLGNEFEEARRALINWTKRDKLLTLPQLIFIYALKLNDKEYTDVVNDLVLVYNLAENQIEVDNNYELSYLNLAIFFKEVFLMALKGFRWRNLYSVESIDVMNRIWEIQSGNIIVIKKMQDEITSSPSLHNHIECCVNLLEAFLFEYMYITACGSYELEKAFIYNFLLPENFTCFNFSVILDNSMNTFIKLQSLIDSPKQTFYREITDVLLDSWNDVNSKLLISFLDNVSSNCRKFISITELMHITSGCPPIEPINLIAFNFCECDYIGRTIDGHLSESEPFVIENANQRLLVYLLFLKTKKYKTGDQDWYSSVKQFAKLHLKLMKNFQIKEQVDAAELWEVSGQALFKFLLELFNYFLSFQKEDDFCHSKQIDFFFEQFAKISPFLDVDQFEEVVRAIVYHEIQLQLPQYAKRASEWLCQSYTRMTALQLELASSEYDMEFLDILKTALLKIVNSFIIRIIMNSQRASKLSSIKYYMKTSFEFFMFELGGKMTPSMFEEEFPVFYNDLKITIGTFSKLEGILEKETHEAYVWHLSFKFLGTGLLLPILEKIPLSDADAIAENYEKELADLMKFILSTSAKNAIVHCLISTITSIIQVKKLRYDCEIKETLCNALILALHRILINHEFSHNILTLPYANDLKKELFQNSIEQLQQSSVFENTIIDHVTETKEDISWMLDDLLKICKSGETVQFLIVKYCNAPDNSLAKKRFLDLLLHCAEHYPVPESYERSLKDSQFLEHKGNLEKSISMSTWIKIPTGGEKNIFSFALGCTLTIMIAEDRKSFLVTLKETRDVVFSKTIQCALENNSKWILLTISFRVLVDTLQVFISLNDQVVTFEYSDDTKSKQFALKAINCSVRWDLAEVFHNTVSIYNAFFDVRHVAALISMGISTRSCWTGINFSNIACISLHNFLKHIGNSDITVIDQEILLELKSSEIRIFEKPIQKQFIPSTNFHRQFASLGGVPAIVILYARALATKSDGVLQNGLLKLLLNVMSKPFIDYERWAASTIKSVIVLLLKSPNAVFDWETLKIFILYCFEFKQSQKLIETQNSPFQRNTFNFQSPEEFCKDLTEAFVRDSEMIERLICNWDLWIAKPAVLVQLLEFLAANVQNAHPYNINRMVPILKTLLKTFSAIANETTIWEVDGKQLATEVKKFAGSIIRSLDGHVKKDIALDLWNCILLLKPAPDMYVENDRINHHVWYDDQCIEYETQNMPGISMQFDKPIPVVHRLEDFNSVDMESDEEVNSHSPTPLGENMDESNIKMETTIDDSWSVCVRKEMYDILIDFVQLSPDDQKLNNDSLCTETLIVLLTKEYSPTIIFRIVSLFEKLVNHSSTVEDQFLMIKSFQFRVLGAQLQQKHLGISIANNLFSILLHEEIDIRAGLDSVHVQNFNPDLLSCSVLDAVFVTFTESILTEDGAEVFTHTCAALTSLYEHNFQLAQAMADRNLDVVMVNAFFLICNSTNHDGIANFGIVDHMMKSAWMTFAKKIVTIGIASSDKKVYGCAVKLIDLCTAAHCQETSDAKVNKNEYTSDSLFRCLANLMLSGLQTLLLDFDSQEHQSASAVNSPINSDNSSPEELDFYFVNEGTHRWTDGLYKFKDKLRQKLQGLSPSLNCPYSKSRFHQVPRTEMTARVKKMLSMCQRFYTVCKPSTGYCDEENSFHQVFLDTLLRITLDDVMISKKPWFFSVQGEARVHLSLLICNTIFDYPRKISKKEIQSNSVYEARKNRILHKLLHVHSVFKMKSIFLTNLNIEACVQATLLEEVLVRPDEDEMTKMAKEFLQKYDLPYHVYAENPELITADVRQAISSEYEMIAQWCNENRKEEIRGICYHSLSWKLHLPTEDYTTTVNEITQDAVQTQGDARKVYYTAMIKHFKSESDAKSEFQKLEKKLSHIGRLPLYESSDHLSSISAVQGPRGERIRFDDCSPMLPEKFHTASFSMREKLSTLCDSKTMLNANRSVKESSLFTCDAILALNGTYSEGVLVFTDVHIYFLSLENNQNVEITYNDILTIHHRRFELKKLAFEIFMENHSTWFFATKNDQDQNIALKFIVERSSCKIAHPSDLQQFSKDWENGKITNFEYIMILNTYSGRTYHDFMQYPIMPHVLASYDENFVDLCDPNSYRNFKKPIAIQNKMMEERYKSCYAMLEETSLNDAHTAPYHYASLYSNLATVSYYLVRLLPHAKIAIDFQDGAFDCPDRIFHSISSTFRLASGGSATDYKELVPEMFTTSEVYMNENKLNFGNCQNGEVVDHVILPTWCKLPEQEINEFLKNPENMKHFQADLFVIAQRHALESRNTQENLHEWIDLIFGYKQTGDPAKNAINLYHPAVYPESIPPDQCEPILYAAHKANVRNIGQVPIQLFNKPHVQRIFDSNDDSHWNCAGIRGLSVGPQLFHHSVELIKDENDDDNKSNKLRSFLLGDDEKGTPPSSPNLAALSTSSTFFPMHKDFTAIHVTFNGYLLTVNDFKLKQIITKRMVREIIDVWYSPDSQLIACLSEFGVIDFYRMNRKNFFGHMTMEILFDGSIQSSYGNFTKFDICQNYSVVFTISDSLPDFKLVSFWDLNEKKLLRCAKLNIQNVDIFGVLKHTGEVIIAETTNYLDKNLTSKLLKYSINGRLMMENTFDFGFIDGDVSQMRPGQGTSMIAVICTDFSIRIIESVTLTCVKYIDLTKIIQSPPKRIAYKDDGNLLIIDDKNKKWKLSRKPAL